jgi:hypothetical protein
MEEASTILRKVAGGLPEDLRQQVIALDTTARDVFSKTLQGGYPLSIGGSGFSGPGGGFGGGLTVVGGPPDLRDFGLNALEQQILNLPPGDPATDARRVGTLR